MNICLISTRFPPEDGGGIGTYIFNLSKGLVELGNTVHIITATSHTDYTTEQEGSLLIHRLPKKTFPLVEPYFPGLRWSTQIYQLIKKLHKFSPIELIEFPNWEASGIASQLLLDIPTVVRAHTPLFEILRINGREIGFGDKMACRFEEWSCRKAKQLVTSTRFHAKTISNEYNIDINYIRILSLGIIDKNPNDKVIKSQGNLFKILYVSRLEHRKGTLAFLRSIPYIHKQYQNIQVDIIGTDRAHAPGGIKFQQFFNENFSDYSEAVTFHGFVDDLMLDLFYKEADILVVPSVYESFGLIYVEAMMYGVPSVATVAGGIPEVITNGVDGFTIGINDCKQIAKCVIDLINDQVLLNTMRHAARETFKNNYDYLVMSKNTDQLYQKLINDKRRS